MTHPVWSKPKHNSRLSEGCLNNNQSDGVLPHMTRGIRNHTNSFRFTLRTQIKNVCFAYVTKWHCNRCDVTVLVPLDKKLKQMNNNVKTLNKWVYIFTLKLNPTKKKRKWDWEVRLVLSDYSLSFLTSGAEKWSQPRLSQTAVPLKSSKRWTVTVALPVLKSQAERFLSDGKGDQKWLNVMSSAWPETNLWAHKLNMRELIKVIEQRVALR